MVLPQIIVISDLHISAAELDDFDQELEGNFVRFLKDELASRPTPVELVINGDFLDFVQAPPWSGRELESQTDTGIPLCFTESQSREKLGSIHSGHLATFRALHDFLASKPDNALVVLPGNHDPDFFWPTVSQDFTNLISDGDSAIAARIRIHLERAYRPDSCPEVWIEHGQQYDPVNSFFISDYPYWSGKNPPILKVSNEERLYACLGTRFLIRYLNSLDAEYPFVDNVKPFSRFVRLFLVSAADLRFGPLKAAVAAWGILRYLVTLAATRPKDLLGIDELEDASKPQLLARLKDMAKKKDALFRKINSAYPGERNLAALLDDPLEQDRVLEWLAAHLDLLQESETARADQLGIGGGDDHYLSLARGFQLDETALLVDGATDLLGNNESGVKLVIMGHTHEAVTRPKGLNYYNTGSWTRYYRFGVETDPPAWSILKEQSYRNFPYQLNYVEIDPGNWPSARMICFKELSHD